MNPMENKTFRYFLYIMAGMLIWQVFAISVVSIIQRDFLMFLYELLKAIIAMIGFVIPATIGALLISKREDNDRG